MGGRRKRWYNWVLNIVSAVVAVVTLGSTLILNVGTWLMNAAPTIYSVVSAVSSSIAWTVSQAVWSVGSAIASVGAPIYAACAAVFGSLTSVFYAAFEWLGAVGSVLSEVWNWTSQNFGWVWTAIDGVYSWIKENIWPYVQWCIDQINTIYKWVDTKLKEVESWVDSLYKSAFGKIYELWDRLTATEERLVKLIGVVDKDLAYKIDKMWAELRAETLGRIEKVYAEIRKAIDTVRVEVLQRIEVVRSFLDEKIVTTWNTLESFKKVAQTIYEKEYTLRDETVRTTTNKYGMTMWKGLFQKTSIPVTKEDIKSGVEWDLSAEMLERLSDLDMWVEGAWKDVAENIDTALKWLDKNLPVRDLIIDDSLLEPEEKAWRDSILDGTYEWMLPEEQRKLRGLPSEEETKLPPVELPEMGEEY